MPEDPSVRADHQHRLDTHGRLRRTELVEPFFADPLLAAFLRPVLVDDLIDIRAQQAAKDPERVRS